MKKFQFNKTAMLQIEKELKIRVQALPVLEAKETALRLEVKKMGDTITRLEGEIAGVYTRFSSMARLWQEMPDLVSVTRVRMSRRLVAGIRVPTIKAIEFEEKPFSAFLNPSWILGGIDILKDIISKKIDMYIKRETLSQMETARRKTTQKVNLYKKVQIPDFENAILKIKRFLEDEENLSKSSQKILKNRMVVQYA